MSLFPDFSRLLTHYLAQRDRSPAWLARRLHLHPGTVNRWLNQATRPATPELVIRVADALGVYTPAERQAFLAAAGFAYQEGAAPALETAAQPLRSRLPVAMTSFVGRERELEQITERLADPGTRLVTIVGLGGMGKSRLAMEVAAQMLDQFADGVWFVALAPITNAALIPAAMAAALELPLQGTTDVEASIIHYLTGKELLLILDNLEQLLDGIHFVERLLVSAPGVKVLATSRARLRLDQEWLFPLDGLTVPSAAGSSMPAPAEYTAVDLFVQRARRLQPEFSLSPSTSAEISRICRLVGGMPLAIELAAAWLRTLPLDEIAGEIQTSLDILATSMRSESQRHYSMRAVFDHSWDLLSEKERQTLMVAGVFRGGFTRQAAAEVAGADLRILSGLVDSSWLQLTPQKRYEIHELARQYAEEKLDAEPSVATQARTAHCAYYAALASRKTDPDGQVTSHRNNLNRLLVELDNIWAGWRWAAKNQDFGAVGEYVAPLAWLSDTNGFHVELVAEFERVCALARELLADAALPESSYRQIALVLARLLYELSFLYGRSLSVEQGLKRGAESIQLLQQLGLDGSSGEVTPFYLEALMYMSLATTKDADYPQARRYCEEIICLTQEKKEHQKEYLAFYCDGINSLSQVAYLQGNFTEAESLLMVSVAQSPRDLIRIVGTDRLALVYVELGDVTRAAPLAAAALLAAEETGNWPSQASALLGQTEVEIAQSRFEEAEKCLDRVFTLAKKMDNLYVHMRFLNSSGRLMRCLGRPVEAQQCYGQAYELAKKMAHRKYAALAQVGVGFSLLDQGKHEEAALHLREALRAAWERSIMPEVIWAVVGLAALRGYAGEPQLAARWLQCAVAHPSCPQRVKLEALELRKRLRKAETADALDAEPIQHPESSLEKIVLALLR